MSSTKMVDPLPDSRETDRPHNDKQECLGRVSNRDNILHETILINEKKDTRKNKMCIKIET